MARKEPELEKEQWLCGMGSEKFIFFEFKLIKENAIYNLMVMICLNNKSKRNS
jgi:hypothetical protein